MKFKVSFNHLSLKKKIELGIMFGFVILMLALLITVSVCVSRGVSLGPFDWFGRVINGYTTDSGKQVKGVGMSVFVISQLFVLVVVGLNIWQALEERSRKNVMKLDLLASVFVIPTLILLSIHNIGDGMINLMMGAGLAIARLGINLWIYDKPKEFQKKVIIPVVGTLTALMVGLFVFNIFDLSTNSWVFWVAQVQLVLGTVHGIAMAFSALHYKVFRCLEKFCAGALNFYNGNLLAFLRITMDIVTFIWFFATFKWLLREHERYEMTKWITGSPECQQKRLEIYQAGGFEIPKSSNSLWKFDHPIAKEPELLPEEKETVKQASSEQGSTKSEK